MTKGPIDIQQPEDPEEIYSDCQKCGSYMIWEDCYNCGGEGSFEYEDDLQFEDPLWYSPGDIESCDICNGKGGWALCSANCNKDKQTK